MKNPRIPVIDVFAGPGGLSEGFASFETPDGTRRFRIALSIEKDVYAHQTLVLRHFFHQFDTGKAPDEYYEHLRGSLERAEVFKRHPEGASAARRETWRATLGEESVAEVDRHITQSLRDARDWVLLGGPPCQPYSVIGRSRNKGVKGYIPRKDQRHFLYKEYLRIIVKHWPPVFVMENVKGLLSARVKRGELILDQILADLTCPAKALRGSDGGHSYAIYSFEKPTLFGGASYDPCDYVVRSELHGIPQARHRLILLGVRDDLVGINPPVLRTRDPVPASAVLSGLPRLRSGLSREDDTPENWRGSIRRALKEGWLAELLTIREDSVHHRIVSAVKNVRIPRKGKGNDTFVAHRVSSDYVPEWFVDSRLGGACNHATRDHIVPDLHRYLFAACFAAAHMRSPALRHFPGALLPDHRNVKKALKGGNFADRFRVQIRPQPSTTVTSHIAKDGHYYIHFDPTQCRSLTVREAARLQTFPDNYFFCGPRTAQYCQVGNAVPPLLANQLAEVVFDVLQQAGLAT